MKKKGNSIRRMLVARKYKEDQKQNQIESNQIKSQITGQFSQCG